MVDQYEVVVVGGGIVGATVACGLARAGISVALLNKDDPLPTLANLTLASTHTSLS